MKKKLIRALSIFMTIAVLLSGLKMQLFAESAEKTGVAEEISQKIEGDVLPDGSPLLSCKSVVLMEETTGKILYAKNAHEALPPASVTKIMTLLLVMEAIELGQATLDSTVTVSANAASMGGSQVYLKEGEQMRLEEMLKCVIIASANDAAVALAEFLCGSVESFVSKMNQKANELGMTETEFENVTGLDDTAEHHLTSAHDIALMSKALIAHPVILQYSSIWMDTIRDGAFGLTNTNRLVRFYQGCTGLKTGSTSKAGFCVSATAKRGSLSLICVIMGAETRDVRNTEAAMLLDWGFATFDMFVSAEEEVGEVEIKRGIEPMCKAISEGFSCVVEKSKIKSIEKDLELLQSLDAPVKQGDQIGRIVFKCNGEVIGESKVYAAQAVEILDFFEILKRLFAKFLLI